MKKLYKVVREDAVLVDQFLLEILHEMIFSLRLASNDPPSIGSVAITEQVWKAERKERKTERKKRKKRKKGKERIKEINERKERGKKGQSKTCFK